MTNEERETAISKLESDLTEMRRAQEIGDSGKKLEAENAGLRAELAKLKAVKDPLSLISSMGKDGLEIDGDSLIRLALSKDRKTAEAALAAASVALHTGQAKLKGE